MEFFALVTTQSYFNVKHRIFSVFTLLPIHACLTMHVATFHRSLQSLPLQSLPIYQNLSNISPRWICTFHAILRLSHFSTCIVRIFLIYFQHFCTFHTILRLANIFHLYLSNLIRPRPQPKTMHRGAVQRCNSSGILPSNRGGSRELGGGQIMAGEPAYMGVWGHWVQE